MGEGSATLGFGRRGRPRGVDAVASPLCALRPLDGACDGLGESARSGGQKPVFGISRGVRELLSPTADHAGGASGAVVSSALNIRRFVSLSPTLCGRLAKAERDIFVPVAWRSCRVHPFEPSQRGARAAKLLPCGAASGTSDLRLALPPGTLSGVVGCSGHAASRDQRGFVVAIGEGAVEAPGHGLRDRPATSALAIKSKLGR